MKPILFNTDMVRAIQNGTKTVTRRVVKPQPKYGVKSYGEYFFEMVPSFMGSFESRILCPYRPGDILYVRETWATWSRTYGTIPRILYKADRYTDADKIKWSPSIHMPRQAARIFLRVTNVRVERLQDITYDNCLREGITNEEIEERDAFCPDISAKWLYKNIWDATIKTADRTLYGWDANPWVWVIEFERISREEDTQK